MNTRHILAISTLTILGWAVAITARAQAPTAASRKIEVSGCLVTLIKDVMVPAEEAGKLMKVNVQGGEAVDESFVIAEIDNRDTLAKRKIAQGELDVEREKAKSDAELVLAREGVNVSKAEYETTLDIQKRNSGAVSETEVRKYKFQLDRAHAQVKVAEVDRVVADLTAKFKEAQVEATANELARRQITAPFNGVVDDVKRQVGEWVQPGEPIARIIQLDRLRVKGMVYADANSPVDVDGKPVDITITTAGGRKETVKGYITYASSIIEVTGEFRVWCDFDNQKIVDPVTKKESWRIQPGSTATMTIDLNPPLPKPPLKAEPAKGGPTLPPAPLGTPRPRSALEASGVKVESLKPVVGEAATTKTEDKNGESKPKTKER